MGRGRDCTPEERHDRHDGSKPPEIAEILHRSRKILIIVINSKKTNSVNATENNKQNPRIKKLTKVVARATVRMWTKDPFLSPRDIVNEINSQFRLNLSDRLLRRCLNNAQLFERTS